jgi:dTDP-4-dehydrorhamnose 3,5-epimerase
MIFPEIKILQPDSFEDYRGELYTVFNQDEHKLVFNHDKVAVSRQHVLRGIHGDAKATKLITCLSGEIYLVVVDNRPESPTYLKWDSVILSETNRKQVLVPPGFGNGHLVLSESATFFYKWSYEGEYPDVKDQFSINWRDPKVNIHWPIDNPILSERDKNSKFI